MLDRRQFLGLVGASGAAVALSPLSAVSIDDDLYVNSRFGVRLRKPPGWSFEAVADMLLRAETIVEMGYELPVNIDILAAELDSMEGPILILRRGVPEEESGPSITLIAGESDHLPTNIVADARLVEAQKRKAFPNYALEAEPRRTRVGGLWGAQWRYRCEVDGSEVQSWDVVAQSDRAFISVCMSASVEVVWDSAEADFVRFLDSLELS